MLLLRPHYYLLSWGGFTLSFSWHLNLLFIVFLCRGRNEMLDVLGNVLIKLTRCFHLGPSLGRSVTFPGSSSRHLRRLWIRAVNAQSLVVRVDPFQSDIWVRHLSLLGVRGAYSTVGHDASARPLNSVRRVDPVVILRLVIHFLIKNLLVGLD